MRSLTLGVVAHVDAGKTSLTERLLFETGASTTLGSVDAGTTRTDSMDLERRRGITIRASVTGFDLDGRTVTIVDTPGHPDFIAEVERAVGVLDAAVLVVSAVEGVQSQTVQIWRALHRAGLPTVIFVNKADRAGADAGAVVAQLREHLTGALVPLTFLEHQGSPDVVVRALSPAGASVIEALAEHDDLIMRPWADDRPVAATAIDHALWSGRTVVPVFFGSALTGAGTDLLLRGIARLPDAAADTESPPAATVFAVDRDPDGHRRTWLRVWRGRIGQRCRLALGGRDPQLVTSIRVSTGDGLRPASVIEAGQVGAVVGLSQSRIGDSVGAGSPRPAQHFPPATVRALVEPVDPARRTRSFEALRELAEEDPLINLELSEADQEAAVSLYGEVQQEVIAAVLEERFDVRVRFAEQSVLCIERVLGTGSATERMRQEDNPYLAGLGLRVEPLPRDAGVVFSPGIERGRLPASFIAATEEGVRKALRTGRSGWTVTDCLVTMTSSQYAPRQSHAHGTFSKAMSTVANDFRHLAPSVVHQALVRAGTYVCHPVDRFEVEIPEAGLPALLARLGRLGAKVDESQPSTTRVVLKGSIQSARVPRLSRSLPDLSSGHGILTTRFDRYDTDRSPVPPTRERRGPDPADRLTWFRAHPR